MHNHYKKIIEQIGEDCQREGLIKTPNRAAEAMKFLTQGYQKTVAEVVNGALFEADSHGMIIVKDIELFSLCEHHLLPFIGKCHVSYIPKKYMLGLSKVARIVDMFAQRLQTQERLTQQVAEAVMESTQCHGVGVVVESKHLCMMMRGVEKQNSFMTTSVMLGVFRDKPQTRNEFLSLIKR
jgi:GTP cyclohydrolase I